MPAPKIALTPDDLGPALQALRALRALQAEADIYKIRNGNA